MVWNFIFLAEHFCSSACSFSIGQHPWFSRPGLAWTRSCKLVLQGMCQVMPSWRSDRVGKLGREDRVRSSWGWVGLIRKLGWTDWSRPDLTRSLSNNLIHSLFENVIINTLALNKIATKRTSILAVYSIRYHSRVGYWFLNAQNWVPAVELVFFKLFMP